MFKIITAIFILAFTIHTPMGLQAENRTALPAQDSTVQLRVTGMGCKTDNKMLETALYRKAGVKKVKITGETITLTYRTDKTDLQTLIEVIESTGTCEDPKARVHKVSVIP